MVYIQSSQIAKQASLDNALQISPVSEAGTFTSHLEQTSAPTETTAQDDPREQAVEQGSETPVVDGREPPTRADESPTGEDSQPQAVDEAEPPQDHEEAELNYQTEEPDDGRGADTAEVEGVKVNEVSEIEEVVLDPDESSTAATGVGVDHTDDQADDHTDDQADESTNQADEELVDVAAVVVEQPLTDASRGGGAESDQDADGGSAKRIVESAAGDEQPEPEFTPVEENQEIGSDVEALPSAVAGASDAAQQVAPQVAPPSISDTAKETSTTAAGNGRRREKKAESSELLQGLDRISDVDSELAVPAAEATGESDSQLAQRREPSANLNELATAPNAAEQKDGETTQARVANTLVGKVGGSQSDSSNVEFDSATQARFVNRVARALATAGDRGGVLRIRLSPSHLGSVRLEVKVQGGNLTARIETETISARTALLENVADLRQRLAEQGIRIEQFDVDLSGREGGQLPEQSNRDQQNSGKAAHGVVGNDSSASKEDASQQSTESPQTQSGDGQLNVII